MDIIDNIIFANLHSKLKNGNPIVSDFLNPYAPVTLKPTKNSGPVPTWNYSLADKMDYCAYQDPSTIEKSVLRHWYDVNARMCYDFVAATATYQVRTGPTVGLDERYSDFTTMRNYHMMFAYLVENTRILQIFERLIDKYVSDEAFGIAGDPLAFNWLLNSEKLFFKNETPSTLITSQIRPSTDAARRNAYWRMFGMDLSFGDINNSPSGTYQFVKAKMANQQFVILFERYLSEIWQGYANARNSSGVNTTDINIIVDLAVQLRELIIARRGDVGANSYGNLNLSREEFASVLVNSWFMFIITDDTPLVQFLNCQSSTIGERLQKIGAKVGIPAHSKCQSLFEMAGPAANILSLIEVGGVLDNDGDMQNILTSLNPPFVATEESNYMTDFLSVINNWERATGHRIKNPESKISATVKLNQGNGMAKPKLPVTTKVSMN